MGISTIDNPTKQPAVWLDGFSMSDFLPPSIQTEVAKAASAVATIGVELPTESDVRPVITADLSFDTETSFPRDELNSKTESSEVHSTDHWGADVENFSDWSERSTHWPVLDPTQYLPVASEKGRIEDNFKAIELLQELKTSKREVTDQDRTTLLKYCGWGGLARIFSPDGYSRHSLADQRDALQALTSEDEYRSMQSSITTAYFTDPAIVSAMWSLVRHLGFQGGRILEPSAGVGHFLAGMPADIANKSDVTAVELDCVSAAMLEASFGPLGVQVHASALEKVRLPVGFYDLVIGNVPFGDFKSLDTSKAPYANWSIHNWVTGKSLDLVRPGGLVVLITSRHTMDSIGDTHRQWLAAHAELIAAYRLPTMAFKGQANTEAVTDIVVLKRREIPNFTAKSWVALGKATSTMLKAGERLQSTTSQGKVYDRSLAINSYYVAQPENVMGLLSFEMGQYGESLNPVFDGSAHELHLALMSRFNDLDNKVYQKAANDHLNTGASSMQRYAMAGYTPPGSMHVLDGRICVSEGDAYLDIDSVYTGTARRRILGMIEVRNCAVKVVAFQAQSQDDVKLRELQTALNGTYDAFVAAHGYLSSIANARLMRSDPDWPLMLALEIWDEEDGKAVKADIFFTRTVGNREVPSKVDNAKDAMLISLALYGKMVISDMATRMARPVMQVVKELRSQSLAFLDPMLARWVPADEYLSGLIREKIDQAVAAGPAYLENVQALQAVLPKDLGPSEVEARLGAPWIPADVIEQFATELVEAKPGDVEILFNAQTATWSMKTTGWRVEWVGDRLLQTAKYGTADRCALTLIEAALNQQPPTITKQVDDRAVVDHIRTIAAREKWQAIREQFRKWVYQDGERCERLLRIYNDRFNQIVNRRFDGAHLTLPGMSTEVVPYPHQKDAIWRIMVNGNTLLAHCVGAGKTLVMCAASMELRRLGKAKKPVHVVQNSCLEQYTAELVRLYPQARVLMASKDDLVGDHRRTFVARIATGDWDAVCMTQSTFERIMLDPEIQQRFVRNMLEEARMCFQDAKDTGAKRSLKELEKKMKDYEARIERLASAGAKDADNVWFNELGIDYVFIDESHAYKNLAKTTKIPRVAGLSNASSQRAFDVFMKTRFIMDLHQGREEGVVMASATPISNSLAELHTVQLYLQPVTLKKFGILEFDSWSASFGETVTGIEMSPDGGGFRTNTRYCRFVNLPELMGIFKGVADIRTKAMLKLPTPLIAGGKPQTKVAKPSQELLDIVAGLVERADLIRKGAVKPNEDNMLKVTHTGRNAALDIRLVDPLLPFDPNGKLAIAAENIARIWNESKDYLGTQLVFSDLGTPNENRFNVYDEMRRLLLAHGIPENEIEFIHDHDSDTAKDKLFKRVREGLVRILVGSTSKMGTGTNVQKRLKAIHQLDAPWVPSSVEQRDGRADRQGNLNDCIELWRYCTERSFDAYSWNLLTVKANFIEQIMSSGSSLRTVEDISMTALTYAEIRAIATGNPVMLEKAAIDADIQKYSLLRSQWEDQRWGVNRYESTLATRLHHIDQVMPAVEQDAKLVESALASKPRFIPKTVIATKAVTSLGNDSLGVAGAVRAHSHMMGGSSRDTLTLGEYGGCQVEITKSLGSTDCYLVGPHSQKAYLVDRPHLSDIEGLAKAVQRTLEAIAKSPEALRSEYRRKTEELTNARKMQVLPFEHEEKLDALLVRQRAIESELSLNKDTEGSQQMATEDN